MTESGIISSILNIPPSMMYSLVSYGIDSIIKSCLFMGITPLIAGLGNIV